MIQTIINFLTGRKSPAAMLAKSDKALKAFKHVVTTLEKANVTIEKEEGHSENLINSLQEQLNDVKKTKRVFESIKGTNKKRIAKVSKWLEDLDKE